MACWGLRIQLDTWQARIMPDTPAIGAGINIDAHRVRITPAAVERAKTRLGVGQIDDLAERLGFSRQTFWRLRRGEYDIRMSEARATAALVGWPIERVFEPAATERVIADAA
jgi:DNA-binding XRE family transcriptional regulator